MAEDVNALPSHIVESVIDAKKEHIAEAIMPRIAQISAREEAYKRIVAETQQGIESYYRRYPERTLDERSKDAEQWSLNGLRAIFRILDEYVISRRQEKHNEQQSEFSAAVANPPAE